jgi:hypothetical protein
VPISDSGRAQLRQLAETILSYRDQILAGNAQWDPTVGDDASRVT